MVKRLALILCLAIVLALFIPAHYPKVAEASLERGIPFTHNGGRVLWNGNTYWHPGVGGMGEIAVGGTESSNSYVMPCAGTWKHLLANITTAVPAGCTRSLYIRVNGSDIFGVTWAAGESGDKSNLVGTAAVAAGAIISLHGSSTGGWGGGASTNWSSCVLFTPTLDVIPFMSLGSGTGGLGMDNTTWSGLNYGSTTVGSLGGFETEAQCVVPISGKFKYFYASQRLIDLPPGETCYVKLRKNGVDTALSFNWSGTHEDKSDLVTEVSCVAGDMVNFKTYSSNGYLHITLGICFVPDDPNQWWIIRPCSDMPIDPMAVSYSYPTLGDLEIYTPWNAAEVTSPFPEGIYISGVALGLTAAPGGVKSVTATLRLNGAPTTLNVTVTGANTFGISGGAAIYPADFDDFSISTTPVGAPGPFYGSISILGSYIKAPTVDTHTASSITSTTATLNGEIIDVGLPADNCDERGFEWGLETGTYTDNWDESGSFGVDNFSCSVTGLISGFTYYFRAFARNPTAGYGYGSELNFTAYSPCTMYEHINIEQDGDSDIICGDNWSFESILATDNHSVNYVYLLLYRLNNPTTLTVSLFLENSTTFVPIGSALTTATIDVSTITASSVGEWVEVYFAVNVNITAGLYYDLVLSQTDNAPNSVVWITSTTAGAGGYAHSHDAGTTWNYGVGPTICDALYALFTCPIPTSPLGLHIIAITQTSVVLAWQEIGYGDNTSYRLVYNLTAYPTTPLDGTLAYDGNITSAEVTDLEKGTTHYFGVWGYKASIYSDNGYFCTVTTSAGNSSITGTDIGDTTDASILGNSPVGGLITYVSQYGQLPQKTVGLLGYSSIFIFVLVAVACYNRSVGFTLICAIVGLVLGVELGVFAVVGVVMAVVIGIAIGTLRGGQPTG